MVIVAPVISVGHSHDFLFRVSHGAFTPGRSHTHASSIPILARLLQGSTSKALSPAQNVALMATTMS